MKKVTCFVLVFLMIMGIMSFTPALADTKRNGETYKTLKYNDILRNPISNWGVKYVVKGTVLQIFRMDKGFQADNDPVSQYLCFRIATKGKSDNVVVCRIDNSILNAFALSNIIEGDKVTVYCSCDGTKKYSTVIGGTVSLPIFTVYSSDDIVITQQKK